MEFYGKLWGEAIEALSLNPHEKEILMPPGQLQVFEHTPATVNTPETIKVRMVVDVHALKTTRKKSLTLADVLPLYKTATSNTPTAAMAARYLQLYTLLDAYQQLTEESEEMFKRRGAQLSIATDNDLQALHEQMNNDFKQLFSPALVNHYLKMAVETGDIAQVQFCCDSAKPDQVTLQRLLKLALAEKQLEIITYFLSHQPHVLDGLNALLLLQVYNALPSSDINKTTVVSSAFHAWANRSCNTIASALDIITHPELPQEWRKIIVDKITQRKIPITKYDEMFHLLKLPSDYFPHHLSGPLVRDWLANRVGNEVQTPNGPVLVPVPHADELAFLLQTVRAYNADIQYMKDIYTNLSTRWPIFIRSATGLCAILKLTDDVLPPKVRITVLEKLGTQWSTLINFSSSLEMLLGLNNQQLPSWARTQLLDNVKNRWLTLFPNIYALEDFFKKYPDLKTSVLSEIMAGNWYTLIHSSNELDMFLKFALHYDTETQRQEFRQRVFSEMSTRWDTILKTTEDFVGLTQLPEWRDPKIREAILAVANSRWPLMITKIDHLLKILTLPLEKFTLLERETLFTSMRGCWCMPLHSIDDFVQLLALPNVQLSRDERTIIFEGVKGTWNNFISDTQGLIFFLRQPEIQLSSPIRAKILEELKNRWWSNDNSVISDDFDLRKLFLLPEAQLSSTELVSILNCMSSKKLGEMASDPDQVQWLLECSTHRSPDLQLKIMAYLIIATYQNSRLCVSPTLFPILDAVLMAKRIDC